MDAEDLAKAALSAIDDWLDEEIVGFEPEEGYANYFSLPPRSVRLAPLGYSPMLEPRLPTLACFYCCWKPTRKPTRLLRSLGE